MRESQDGRRTKNRQRNPVHGVEWVSKETVREKRAEDDCGQSGTHPREKRYQRDGWIERKKWRLKSAPKLHNPEYAGENEECESQRVTAQGRPIIDASP